MADPPTSIADRSELFAANARGRFAEPRIGNGYIHVLVVEAFIQEGRDDDRLAGD